MSHAQKPDFVFRRNVRVHLNRRCRQFSRHIGSRGVRVSGSNARYTVFRGSVKSTGYPFHSPVSPFTSPSCVTVCHHISTGLYRPVHLSARVCSFPFALSEPEGLNRQGNLRGRSLQDPRSATTG
jgi:hypothetical protein